MIVLQLHIKQQFLFSYTYIYYTINGNYFLMKRRLSYFIFQTIQDALQRTKVCRIRSSHELIKTLRHLVSLRKAEQACLALERRRPILVIVDSLPAVIFKVLEHILLII